MKHIYYHSGKDNPTFVVLHGTGGNENSLLPAIEHLKENINILSIRGDVTENGMLRFFERQAEGVYNLESLDKEMQKLNNFIRKASQDYDFAMEKVILFGFSNGANIGIHLLLNSPDAFHYGIFMAPLYPLEVEKRQGFSHKKVFLSMGRMDPICPMEQNQALLELFDQLEIERELEWVLQHELTQSVVVSFTNWYLERFHKR